MVFLKRLALSLTVLALSHLPAGAQTLTVTPAPRLPAATPEDLVGKSVQDLAKGQVGAALKDDVTALQRGPLLIHGNYCGIGNRPGSKPVDSLDEACMRHDACTTTGDVPNCACNDRLRLESAAIAQDPQTPPNIQGLAAATAASMAVLICK